MVLGLSLEVRSAREPSVGHEVPPSTVHSADLQIVETGFPLDGKGRDQPVGEGRPITTADHRLVKGPVIIVIPGAVRDLVVKELSLFGGQEIIEKVVGVSEMDAGDRLFQWACLTLRVGSTLGLLDL